MSPHLSRRYSPELCTELCSGPSAFPLQVLGITLNENACVEREKEK